jgi:hypothetical protein
MPTLGAVERNRVWLAIIIFLIALTAMLAVTLARGGAGDGRTGAEGARSAPISTMDLARVQLEMSRRDVRALLGKPESKERARTGRAKRECWRYDAVENGFVRLCFVRRSLVSKQQTFAG